MNNETIQSLRNYALADKAKTTPRTDAATIPFDAKGCERDDRVPVSFARQLERELQQATADNSSLAERLTAAELERDRLGAELEELQGSHDLNQIASDALNDLRADLDRVTAERQNWKEWAEEARAMFHKQIDAAAVMKTRAEQAEQRNAELVAALRPIYALRKNCEGDIGWRGQKDAKVGWVTVRDILALEHALARAESATPDKQEGSK